MEPVSYPESVRFFHRCWVPIVQKIRAVANNKMRPVVAQPPPLIPGGGGQFCSPYYLERLQVEEESLRVLPRQHHDLCEEA
jgi:hypothetical protein